MGKRAIRKRRMWRVHFQWRAQDRAFAAIAVARRVIDKSLARRKPAAVGAHPNDVNNAVFGALGDRRGNMVIFKSDCKFSQGLRGSGHFNILSWLTSWAIGFCLSGNLRVWADA